jgi:hypothetical protein
MGLRFEGPGQKSTGVEIAAGSPSLGNLILEGLGTGIRVKGATPHVSQCSFLRCDVGVHLIEGARPQLEDCLIEETSLYPMWITDRSAAKATRLRFWRARIGGVVVMEGSQAEFLGCEWLDSPAAAMESHPFGAQLLVLPGSAATLSAGCRIANGTMAGVFVSGGTLTMSDCLVEKNNDAGVEVCHHAQAHLTGTQLSGNRGAGLLVHDGASVTASGLKVVGNAMAGIGIKSKSAAGITQSLVLGNLCGAIVGEGSRLRLEDCDLRGNSKDSFVVSPDSQCERTRVQA